MTKIKSKIGEPSAEVCGIDLLHVVGMINAKAERWEARLGGRD